jgi:hypothetical protein
MERRYLCENKTMRRVLLFSALFALLLSSLSFGQYGYPRSRRGGSGNKGNTLPYGGPAVTLHGTLKFLSKKEIVIETEDAQAINIRRSGKTKFFKDNKEVKPSEIAVGALLAVDVTKDPDLQPSAIAVIVNPPAAKAPDK